MGCGSVSKSNGLVRGVGLGGGSGGRIFARCQGGAGMVGRKAEFEGSQVVADAGEGGLETLAAIEIVVGGGVQEGEQAALHDLEACACGLGIDCQVGGTQEWM